MGMTLGLSMLGKKVVTFYPRWDFIISAANQLINHVDKYELMTEQKPHIIVRVGKGSDTPLDPGHQHKANYIEEFKLLTKSNKEIVVISNNINKENVKILNKLRIKSYKDSEIPGFRLGDGKYMVKTSNGTIKSELGQYYKISNINYDLIFSDSFESFNKIKVLYPFVPKIFNIKDENKIPYHDSIINYLTFNDI